MNIIFSSESFYKSDNTSVMRRIGILTIAVFFLVLALGLQSCATIFGGRTNTLVFDTSEPQQTEVFIDDTLVGTAPGKIRLPKGTIQHGSMLEIRAEGYESEEYLLLLKPHAGYVIADFVAGAIPLIIDFGTSDILRPKPRKFIVDMESAEEVKP
jgi:hypothetical protein